MCRDLDSFVCLFVCLTEILPFKETDVHLKQIFCIKNNNFPNQFFLKAITTIDSTNRKDRSMIAETNTVLTIMIRVYRNLTYLEMKHS